MWFEQVFFFIAGAGALAGALGVVLLRNPFYSVLALVGHLLSLAVLFLLLHAEFLAAGQVVVYAGAVMVLYIFVVAYIGGLDTPLRGSDPATTTLGPIFAVALGVELCIAFIASGLQALGTRGADIDESTFGGPAQIGNLLLNKFLLPFEAASFLLLMAAVGAIVLARRRRGLEDEPAAGAPSGASPSGGAA
jgi:NADH:ubiquinone oxidoreductase subunit 6 (subunit J)